MPNLHVCIAWKTFQSTQISRGFKLYLLAHVFKGLLVSKIFFRKFIDNVHSGLKKIFGLQSFDTLKKLRKISFQI